MLPQTLLVALSGVITAVYAADAAIVYDSAGYYLPDSGLASTSNFYTSNEFTNGTACGMKGYPNNKAASYQAGGGPGYLYAAINQLGFGANPNIEGGGGPGGACGICYQITPKDSSGASLDENSLIFMIVDECAIHPGSTTDECNACNVSSSNYGGKSWHFNIGVDGMNENQYNQFFSGVDSSKRWADVSFQKIACGVDSPVPPLQSWGCISNCKNNDKGNVCATSSAPAKTTSASVVYVTETITKTSSTHKYTSTVYTTVTVS